MPRAGSVAVLAFCILFALASVSQAGDAADQSGFKPFRLPLSSSTSAATSDSHPSLPAPGSFPSAIAPASYPPVQSFQVPMTDGILLNTDVRFPQSGQGPWPVILYRTPYNIQSDHVDFSGSGVVTVSQDTRGRFGSQGLDRMFRDDGWGPDNRDGYDTVEWILSQPWCDGRIGTMGGSARGITQVMLGGAVPDSVRCMHVVAAASDMYHHAAFPGGAFRKRDVEGWLIGQGSQHMIDSLYAHPDDDDWWSWADATGRHHLQTTPTYQYGGWFDLFLQGNIDSFTGLQYGGGPGAVGNQKLIIGPWSHSSIGGNWAGELTFPGGFGVNGEALIGSFSDWFLYWLLDQPNDIMERPPVAYYLMGDADDPTAPGNEWRTADHWPPPAVETSFYLRAGGALSLDPAPGRDSPYTYLYNPNDPVPTLGGGNLIGESGPYDQRPVLYRPDVLLYQSEILDEPMEVVGRVRVELFASSDRLDTDFTARLCDVYPDGRVMLVCDGIIRGRYRNSFEQQELLVPGEVYSFWVDLWDTAIAFNRGHRILLAVSSSNAPRFDPNPNTGDPFMQSGPPLVAENSVFIDSDHPSRLVLMVRSGLADVDQPQLSEIPVRLLLPSPNPVRDDMVLRYSLSRPGDIRLSVHDVAGRLVRTLAVGHAETGGHMVQWNVRDRSGRRVPAGSYFLRLQTGEDVATGTICVVR